MTFDLHTIDKAKYTRPDLLVDIHECIQGRCDSKMSYSVNRAQL
jgi:hypothetical protein